MKTRLIGVILAVVLALAGTVVLTGYVRGADARASAGAELVPVYVVSARIEAGAKAEDIEKSITQKEVPALAAVPGRVMKLSGLAGRVADVALLPGEQLIEARWVDPAKLTARGEVALPDGMQSVTVALPVEHVVGGTVKAGDTVGVLISATMTTPEGKQVPLTRQVFHKVLVTAVQAGTTTQADGAAKSSDPVDTVMVTLARLTPDVEKLVWGQEYGSVWLTLEPEGADESGSRNVDIGQVFP
jgi:pilus assembly protein CpaB